MPLVRVSNGGTAYDFLFVCHYAYRHNTTQANSGLFYYAIDLNTGEWKSDAVFTGWQDVVVGDYKISGLGTNNYQLTTKSNGTAYSVVETSVYTPSPQTTWNYEQSVTANTAYTIPFSHRNNGATNDLFSVLAFKAT